jgi:hypothetical protein
VILINMAGTAREEALAGGDVKRTQKANQQIFTVTTLAPVDSARFKAFESVLFPAGAQDENQRNDIRIVADAIHYAAILVTNDGGSKSQQGGIRGHRDEPQALCAKSLKCRESRRICPGQDSRTE